MRISLCLAFAAMLFVPQIDPANPWPGHGMPDAGWFCRPSQSVQQTATDAHACECLGMTKAPICTRMQQDMAPNPDDDDMVPVGEPHAVPATNDNAKCKVYCHKDHCTCMRQCRKES